jgi:hypothetical protein
VFSHLQSARPTPASRLTRARLANPIGAHQERQTAARDPLSTTIYGELAGLEDQDLDLANWNRALLEHSTQPTANPGQSHEIEALLSTTKGKPSPGLFLSVWLEEDIKVEDDSWDGLKAALDQDRLSSRKLFGK